MCQGFSHFSEVKNQRILNAGSKHEFEGAHGEPKEDYSVSYTFK